jgi:hypothetical protein
MKRKIFLLISVFLLLAVFLAPGCKRVSSSMNGSGKIVDQDLNIKDFTNINAKGVYNLYIRQGDNFKVTVSLDDNLFNRLQVSMERKTLKLGVEAPATFFPTTLKLTITMPQLLGLNLSGGANANITGFKSPDDFTLFLSGKGLLDGSIIASNLVFHLSEGSKVILSGSGLKLDLTSRGGSLLDMRKYDVMRAQVRLDESSEAILNVTGQFDVDLKNKSKLFFSGNPVFTNTSVTGGSTMSMIQK